jgi:hypothetical protein
MMRPQMSIDTQGCQGKYSPMLLSLVLEIELNLCSTTKFDQIHISGHLQNLVTTEQHAFKNVKNYLNSNIYSYLETSGGQSSNLYLNVAHFFNTSVNKTPVAA